MRTSGSCWTCEQEALHMCAKVRRLVSVVDICSLLHLKFSVNSPNTAPKRFGCVRLLHYALLTFIGLSVRGHIGERTRQPRSFLGSEILSSRPSHKAKCKKYHARPGGVARQASDQRDLLQRMIGMSLDITTLIVAAARKLLWRPEYISGGMLTRSLRVEYTYKVRHVAPPSRQRVTLSELKTCPKSRVPFILNISLTEPDKGSGAPDGTLLETHVIPVWFSNRDNGEFFQYMPMILSSRDADETVRSHILIACLKMIQLAQTSANRSHTSAPTK